MPFTTISGKEINAEYITRLKDEIKQWRQPYYQRWIEYYKQYRSYQEESNYPFRSNLFIPYTFALVEHIVPAMLASFFSTEPIVSVVPRKGAVAELSYLIETIVNYFLEDTRTRLYQVLEESLKEAAIYGTAFMRILPVFGNENYYNVFTDEFIPIMDRVSIESIDLFRVYPDWRAKSLEDMRFIIIEHEKTEEELKELEALGLIPEGITEQLSPTGEVDQDKTKRLTSVGKGGSAPVYSTTKFYKVYEYWDKNCVVWICGSKILYERPNVLNRLPFVLFRFTKAPHELYGIGIPEMVSDLQEELNTVRNQRIDNLNLIINRMFIVNKLADIDMDSLVSYAGNIILTNDVDAIKPLTTPDITRSAYLEEEIIRNDMDLTTGLYAAARGAPPVRKEPATTTMRLQQASLIRFDSIVKRLEYDVLREIGSIVLFYIRRYVPPEKFVEIVGFEEFFERGGPLFYTLPFETILKNYHFKTVGTSFTGIRELRTQQLLQAFALFSKLPFVNLYEFAKLVLREGFGVKNVNQLLLAPQPQVGVSGQPQEIPPSPEAQATPTPEPTLPGRALEPVRLEDLVTAAERGASGNEGVNAETLLRALGGIITE